MSIKKEGSFYVWEDAPWCPSLGIETSQLKNCIGQINAQKYEGIFGSPSFGFKQDNLDFAKDIPHIRYIHFWEVNLKNIDGVYALHDLEFFSIISKRPAIDFSQFQKIQKLIWEHKKKDTGIGTLKHLKQIDLWRYKNATYDKIDIPTTLETLEINWSDHETLNGLPTLPNLKELQIHYCRNFKSLTDIESIAPNLEKLVVTRCKNIKMPEHLHTLPKLTHAWVQDKKII